MTSTPRSPHASPVEQALKRRAQISPETLRKIRAQGTVGVNPVNVAALEQALELPQGAIASIQDGRAPGGPYPPGAEAAGEVELVDAPGGGQAWRLVRVVGGEELELTISARPWLSREVAARELTRIADQMEAEAVLRLHR